MDLIGWLTGKKNPAAPTAASTAANAVLAAPSPHVGGRKRTHKARKASKGRKGRRASRRVQRGGCTSACWEPRLKKCVC